MNYSIIVVAYRSQDPLTRCLASLAEHAPADKDAELILVDNSPERVEVDLKALLPHFRRVCIVWDGVNRGFAEGCNEGARNATGKYLVFVNPDTVVFAGWADRLLGHLRPEVGAVGPISNFVAGYQNAIYHMQASGNSWNQIATLAAKGMNRRGVATKLLIGFFLLMPRTVWDKVGGMDPALFLGCDDLDLSLRLRDLGYELIIASDVFVYHEGHTSFYAMGEEDAVALNRKTEKVFLDKLAKKYPAGVPSSTELWDCEILPTQVAKRMTLSICMIVRDELENLKALLPQLKFADQIVIVDTGSTDSSGNWVTGFMMSCPWGQQIHQYEFPWVDDFAAARNFALSKCTGDYVLWLDADDRVPEHSAGQIRAALDFPGPLTAAKAAHFSFKLRDHLPTGRLAFTDQPRLFPRVPGIYWEDRVHESYQVSADKLGLKLIGTAILVDHYGYQDAGLLARKHERNIRLLDQQPDTPMKFYQLGKSFGGLGLHAEARDFWKLCLSRDWGTPLAGDFGNQLFYLIALSWYQEKGFACEQMDWWLKHNPKPDAIFLRAERLFIQGFVGEAESLYTAYSKIKGITDYYGTDWDTFVVCSEARLDMIERLRGVPAVA